ncbi:MAG: hypothetical protein ACYDEP_03055 [Acidimicrobiales bacterium]|jgi:hypothetical protein
MPRFLSSEWVDEFNEALSGFQPSATTDDPAGSSPKRGPDTSLFRGPLRVTEIVYGVPPDDATVTLTLVVSETEVSLELRAPAGAERDLREKRDDVIVYVPYNDAASLARGDFDAAAALGSGRVKVRGNLTALATSQRLLASAAERLSGLGERTTF